jgi:antitoxin component YwqK of YwqJK toxin-antitoxin module
MNDFYVYGLVDPRTNLLFYIGKGKGNRVNQHFHNKVKSDGNDEKIRVINEIHKANLIVKKIQISQNLFEESAYVLERILIYRIGRLIFDEGPLTNIQPGGLWTSGDKYILEEGDVLNEDVIILKYPELLPILELFPHKSKKFTLFSTSENSEMNIIYVYRKPNSLDAYRKIKKIKNNEPVIFDLNSFLNYFDLKTSIKVLNVLKSNSLPMLFLDSIYSKSAIKKRPDLSKIPFEDFDLIDFNFVKKINKSIANDQDIKIDCFYSNGSILAEMELLKNQLSFIYYYENGKIKHKTIEFENYKEFKSYDENGVLEIEKTYNKYGVRITYKAWYENKRLKEEECRNEWNSLISDKTWFENGVLKTEMLYENGVVKSHKRWNNKKELISDTDEDELNKTNKSIKKDDQFRLNL